MDRLRRWGLLLALLALPATTGLAGNDAPAADNAAARELVGKLDFAQFQKDVTTLAATA